MDETMNEIPVCSLCGEPMPVGEEMFKYHGYSGDCPKPPLPTPTEDELFECWLLKVRFPEMTSEQMDDSTFTIEDLRACWKEARLGR